MALIAGGCACGLTLPTGERVIPVEDESVEAQLVVEGLLRVL